MEITYSKYEPHFDEWESLTLTQKFERRVKQYKDTWRGREYEGLAPLVANLDACLTAKDLLYPGMFSIKTVIQMYNLVSNFADFKGVKNIMSIRAGFGGSGGQVHDYHLSEDGIQCYRPTYVTGSKCEYYHKCDPQWFAMSFCTEDQWKLVSAMG
jgi:hypothetical protein